MALRRVDILEELGLTGRSAELQTRLARVEQAVQSQPQLQSTLSRLRVSHQGFTDWHASLQKFEGDEEQTRQAEQPQQRAEALKLLNQIDTNIYSLQRRLLLEDDTYVDSEELRADAVELDQAVLNLIRLFPGARRAGLFSIEQSGPAASSARARPPIEHHQRPLPPLVPTKEEPLEEVEDTVPPLQQRHSTSASSPPPRRTSSGDGSTYHRTTSMDDAKVIVGTFYAATVVAHSQPLPQAPGNVYGHMQAKGNSSMLIGDAIGGSPFVETAEPQNMTRAPGLFRRATDKLKRKESMK
ncbi:hypothetical protein LTR70_005901 [Exophiala xenobiotica]|uniref:Uncharacterized protein n=1 Tax=Lithohypha guttulata TaxID=1690604 RepID=A0ABR0K7D0_9EURO|nr:hypothetical protein LTR24_006117 [Lithohypha guttulata]KAK5317284.1 hypothetical protein LTR70_005901 [Exophiala xenobiotica]